MKCCAALGAILFAAAAGAAPAPLDIKGFSLGMPYDQARALIGNASCMIGDLPGGHVDADCDVSAPDIDARIATLAGRPVAHWRFIFKGSALALVACDLAADDAMVAARAFRAKFGEPLTQSHEPATNAFGARVTQSVVAWRRGKSSLAVTANVRHFGAGSVILSDLDPTKPKPDI